MVIGIVNFYNRLYVIVMVNYGEFPQHTLSNFDGRLRLISRLAKCRQIGIFAMTPAFIRKYREIMTNNGKYNLQPSTFRLGISITEVICLNISFLLVYQVSLVQGISLIL